MNSVILQAIKWLKDLEPTLPANWPVELPPETDPDFWTLAAQFEMKHRTITSQKIEYMILSGGPHPSTTDLELWFYRRRVEWAGQLLIAAAQRQLEPDMELPAVLKWVLIDSWEKDGCIGFWTHAVERGGKPHPENPDGTSPLGSI